MGNENERSAERRVRIFDTTLRDGEQSPGIALNRQEKLEIAHQLARLGVDIIEAGFPITSPGDFESVQAIAREVEGPVVCALARTAARDIEVAGEAIRDAERRRIHTFIATSDLHIERKLQTTREDVKGQARAAVAQARELTDDVEFSPEDGSRSDIEFMAEVIQIAIDEGATTINVPDTVGYALPGEYGRMFTELYRLVPDLHKVTVSVHCHNDLGLAVANSLAGLEAGCRQVECAVNGIGERAGNASLEEIVMLLRTREPALGLWTGIETREIARTSRLVSRLTGYPVQPNKAIVGRNAFAHEAGIHQDGVLKERRTYEIMDATSVGLASNSLVLGKHSGRHALAQALEEMGFTLDSFDVESSTRRPPHAKVTVTLPEGGTAEGSFSGDGPIDAVMRAIDVATGLHPKLTEFTIGAVTEGQDALGEVSVVVEVDGFSGAGQSVSTDIIDAAARAYLRALSVAVARSQRSGDELAEPIGTP